MPYTIKKADGITTLITLADGLIDQTVSSLTLVGKNVSNYGLFQNENFVYLLQNFANTSSPPNPTVGQLWYDTTHSNLNVYNGLAWISAGGALIQNSSPVGLSAANAGVRVGIL